MKPQIKIGKKRPQMAVGLAYMNTPDGKPEFIHASVVHEQYGSSVDEKEVLVAGDLDGQLYHIENDHRDMPVTEAKLGHVFPVDEIALSDEFMSDKDTLEHTLYHVMDLKYHFEHVSGTPNEVVAYNGSEIQLVGEDGNRVKFPYKVFVMALEENPQLYWVRIYSKETNGDKKVKVRYNHVSTKSPTNALRPVFKEVELYQGKENLDMLEGAKERFLNAMTVFRRAEEEFDVSEKDDRLLKVEDADGGYRFKTKHKSEYDKRTGASFSYKLGCFWTEDGVMKRVESGWLSDEVHLRPLRHQLIDYIGDKKVMMIPMKDGILQYRDILTHMIPETVALMPEDATYYIADREGHVQYLAPIAGESDDVGTATNIEQGLALAKRVDSEEVWEMIERPNTRLKSLDIPHQIRVIEERQVTELPFTFSLDGVGQIVTTTFQESKWRLYIRGVMYLQDLSNVIKIGQRELWTSTGRQPDIQVLKTRGTNPWNDTALASEKTGLPAARTEDSDWAVKGNGYANISNKTDFGGYFRKDYAGESDYEFSTMVTMDGMGDDDVVGILFRVRDKHNFYMFAWEGDNSIRHFNTKTSTKTGTGYSGPKSYLYANRIMFDEWGISFYDYTQLFGPSFDQSYWFNRTILPDNFRGHWATNNRKFFEENIGFGLPRPQNAATNSYKYPDGEKIGLWNKRIMKATKNTTYRNPGELSGNSNGTRVRLSTHDMSGCSFQDISDRKHGTWNTNLAKKGWIPGQTYRITVRCVADRFYLYIKENPTSDARDIGDLCMVGHDPANTHKSGSFGFFTVSYNATFKDPVFTKVIDGEVQTPWKDIIFENQDPIRVTEKNVGEEFDQQLRDIIKSKPGYDPTKEIVFENVVVDVQDAGIESWVDEQGKGNVWLKSNSPLAGGTKTEPFDTRTEGLTIQGSGIIEFGDDGSKWTQYEPKFIPKDLIPEEVTNFSWGAPQVNATKGPVNVWLEGLKVQADGSLPAITQTGRSVTLPAQTILKSDGVQEVIQGFTEQGIIDLLKPVAPRDEQLLRIERIDGEAVNHRFEMDKVSLRYPVDQMMGQQGVNRFRMKWLYDSFAEVGFDIGFKAIVEEELETNMVDFFGDDAIGRKLLFDPATGPSTWEVIDGELKETTNRSDLTAVYNNGLPKDDMIVDLSFTGTGLDDDAVAFLFRVKDDDNFYMWVMEAQNRRTVPNNGRTTDETQSGKYVFSHVHRSLSPSQTHFETQVGWKKYHSRVFQVKNGVKRLVAKESRTFPNGWLNDRKHVARLDCVGSSVSLQFKENEGSPDFIEVFKVKTDWDAGTFGVGTISQTVTFHELKYTKLHTVSGELGRYTSGGKRMTIYTDDARTMIDPQVGAEINNAGLDLLSTSSYRLRLQALNVEGNGRVVVPETGRGPIVVHAERDLETRNGDMRIVAWTNCEKLLAIPVFGMRFLKPSRYVVETPRVGFDESEDVSWSARVKGGRWRRKVRLPFYEPGESIPLVYQMTAGLIPLRPASESDEVYAILDYELREGIGSHTRWVQAEQAERIGINVFKVKLPILPTTSAGNVTLSAYATSQTGRRRLRIGDIDAAAGEFHVLDVVMESERVYADYASEETFLEYEGYRTAGGFHEYDLNPSEGHYRGVVLDGYVPIVTIDEVGQVVERPSMEWIAQDSHLYIRPHKVTVNGVVIETNEQTLMHTTERQLFEETSARYHPFLVPLARIEIDPPEKADTKVIDGRRRGGGLAEWITEEEIAQRDEDALGFWDIGTPMLHDDAGAAVIEVPERLLETFTEDEIKQIVERRLALGVLPLIRYVKEEKVDTSEGELRNPEFESGLHADYYDAVRSSGLHSIEYLPEGTGDDWILRLQQNAKYVLSIPRSGLVGARYEIQVKARMSGTGTRKVFKVERMLGAGGVEAKQSGDITGTDWMVYSQTIAFGADDKMLRVTLNPNDYTGEAHMLIDYVRVIQRVEVDDYEVK
ncbi:hypothetical protein ACQR3P_29445 [Rhodococcus sp. IEGM1300]